MREPITSIGCMDIEIQKKKSLLPDSKIDEYSADQKFAINRSQVFASNHSWFFS